MADFDPFNFDRLWRGECCYSLCILHISPNTSTSRIYVPNVPSRNRSQKNAPGEFRENFTDYQSTYPDDLQSDLHGILRIRDAVE